MVGTGSSSCPRALDGVCWDASSQTPATAVPVAVVACGGTWLGLLRLVVRFSDCDLLRRASWGLRG